MYLSRVASGKGLRDDGDEMAVRGIGLHDQERSEGTGGGESTSDGAYARRESDR